MKDSNKLIDRDSFREGVFLRDHHKCVICQQPATAAHHILERRLFSDGGYYISNGASLCDPCHILAEETTLSCETIREACGVIKAILPPDLYEDATYDKWGNQILPNGQRLRGELFNDESVQKILTQGGVLSCFTWKVRAARTRHLPWSQGVNDDDRVLDNLSAFIGKRVICSIKMDGESTTMGCDYIHARSPDSKCDPTRTWVYNLHATIRHDIP